MKFDELQELRNELQNVFTKEEMVEITIYNHPYTDGDLGCFILHTNCFYGDESHKHIDPYLKRAESFLESKGYEIENKYYGNCAGGPIKGTVIAFRPRKDED